MKNLTNYQSAFSLLKSFSIIVVIAAILVCGAVSFYAIYTINQYQNKIYLLDKNGVIYNADKIPQSKETRKYEYMNHAKIFYTLMFSFDQNNFQSNVENALLLSGNCGKDIYYKYNEDKVYSNQLVNKNIIYKIQIDSVNFDINTNTGKIYAIQTILRGTSEIKRTLYSSFSIIDTYRSDKNPHGCSIENLNVFESNNINSINPQN